MNDPSRATSETRIKQRIVVETDEAPVHLFFLSRVPTDLDPWATVTNAAGSRAAFALAPGDRITLAAPGRYVVMLEADAQRQGHRLCVLLSAGEMDAP